FPFSRGTTTRPVSAPPVLATACAFEGPNVRGELGWSDGEGGDVEKVLALDVHFLLGWTGDIHIRCFRRRRHDGSAIKRRLRRCGSGGCYRRARQWRCGGERDRRRWFRRVIRCWRLRLEESYVRRPSARYCNALQRHRRRLPAAPQPLPGDVYAHRNL